MVPGMSKSTNNIQVKDGARKTSVAETVARLSGLEPRTARRVSVTVKRGWIVYLPPPGRQKTVPHAHTRVLPAVAPTLVATYSQNERFTSSPQLVLSPQSGSHLFAFTARLSALLQSGLLRVEGCVAPPGCSRHTGQEVAVPAPPWLVGLSHVAFTAL